MAHGKLGSGADRDTLRTAAAWETVANGTTTDSLITLEATEDRYIRAVMVQVSIDQGENGLAQAEVSTSATNQLLATGNQTNNATSSGVLAYTYSKADSTNGWAVEGEQVFPVDWDGMDGNIEWEEDEEILVHADNQTASGQAVRVIVYYERQSDC